MTKNMSEVKPLIFQQKYGLLEIVCLIAKCHKEVGIKEFSKIVLVFVVSLRIKCVDTIDHFKLGHSIVKL
jgi:hypothetical protein